MGNGVLVSGSNTISISEEVCRTSKIPMIEKIVRRFPDGEIYVRFSDVNFKEKNVYIIHSMAPRQNDSLIELFLSVDVIREYSPRKINLIAPYMAYARQHKKYNIGEALSLRTIIKILKILGVSEITTIDAHFCRREGTFNFFGMKIQNLTAAPLIFEYIKRESGIKDFVVVGVDAGSRDFLSKIRSKKVFLRKEKYCPICNKKAIKCECKTRKKSYKIVIKGFEKVKNKNVMILDDIISTGGTMSACALAVKKVARSVYIGCTHGLFLGRALDILKENCDLIVSTNTIKSKASKVSIAPLIKKVIR
ncbi:MAG: ribose-phosphate diphosphokinase [Candidatus Parvarchaeota archaeon]|nr:ribose-phosphate diphosphokinase [Candidatus Jingweiarchaeum tengchongense]MCW1300273.1 ribose-phosphate diphosphokinase [Candidatus Jingweiarchaeum tengchongense]MCW1304493.1 ribose-phosphate diphosphokinase [Candidatus Jingweiarchaeum tengchongense]MCW1305779.1 ribose-phosphate diphosphokinase [Candidatus Jingweiarchaeum tengchongense]MCW1310165.1 ribose-phosphate diphosphokinase [Candidatus Jingweiarchaeum tengchongense]